MKGTDFIPAFRAAATQLRTFQIAGDWWRLSTALATEGITLTPEQAAAWASRGFYPGEAEANIRAGITAEMDREMEAHAEAQAGGPDNLAAMRIAELLGSGALLGPDDVVTVQDPTDPNVEIIVPKDGR